MNYIKNIHLLSKLSGNLGKQFSVKVTLINQLNKPVLRSACYHNPESIILRHAKTGIGHKTGYRGNLG
jgi:hypothetical protein